jgi:hypothetical protein
MKNPWVVAVLNYFFWGLGTLLSGKRVLTALLLLAANLSLRWADLALSPAGPRAQAAPQMWPFIVGGMAVAGIAFAIDGYREARASA